MSVHVTYRQRGKDNLDNLLGRSSVRTSVVEGETVSVRSTLPSVVSVRPCTLET